MTTAQANQKREKIQINKIRGEKEMLHAMPQKHKLSSGMFRKNYMQKFQKPKRDGLVSGYIFYQNSSTNIEKT